MNHTMPLLTPIGLCCREINTYTETGSQETGKARELVCKNKQQYIINKQQTYFVVTRFALITDTHFSIILTHNGVMIISPNFFIICLSW